MNVNANKDSALPVYERIKAQIKNAIVHGVFPEGRLPQMRGLAEQYQVSLRTMHRAINGLLEDGTCVSRPRIGVFVNPLLFSGFKKKILYIGSSYYKSADAEYAPKLIGLMNPELYPDCQIDMKYFNFSYSQSREFDYELKQISSQYYDCLLLNLDLRITRRAMSELLNFPCPVFVIGDFSFGEFQETTLNQIREDTAERGEKLIETAVAFGKKNILIITHAEQENYYVKLLKKGALQKAEEDRVNVRFLPFFNVIKGADDAPDERQARGDIALKELFDESVPDTVILDGYYRDAEKFVQLVRKSWSEDILFISTGNYIRGCMHLHADYSEFAKRASAIISASLYEQKRFVGRHTLHGLINYQPLTPYVT